MGTTSPYYFERMNNSGFLAGRTLIQAHGEIGGLRYVFVKLIGASKDAFRTPTSGGKLLNPFKGNAKIFAGDFMEYDPGINGSDGATVKILKSYQVAKQAASATAKELLIVRDGYKHIPFVGDNIMVAPETLDGTGAAVTVTAVEATTDTTEGDVWKLTLSGTLGQVDKGKVLVEAAEAGDTKKPMVTNPNGYAQCDYDFLFTPSTGDPFEDGARYMLTPFLANDDTVMYLDRMSPIPPAIKALNKSRVNGWFHL